MFEAVMQKDNAEATRTSINGTELNLSDAEQLFKALQASAVRTTDTRTYIYTLHMYMFRYIHIYTHGMCGL